MPHGFSKEIAKHLGSDWHSRFESDETAQLVGPYKLFVEIDEDDRDKFLISMDSVVDGICLFSELDRKELDEYTSFIHGSDPKTAANDIRQILLPQIDLIIDGCRLRRDVVKELDNQIENQTQKMNVAFGDSPYGSIDCTSHEGVSFDLHSVPLEKAEKIAQLLSN